MKDLGEAKQYLGIEMEYNKAERKMTLSQQRYIESLAKKYDAHVDTDWAADITDRKSTTGIVIRVYGNTVLDTDWAADITDRKSTTGIVIRVYGNTVLWKSQKQKIDPVFRLSRILCISRLSPKRFQ
ncbi:hypothetical protein QE152_g27294 [Popillia japonica]|uniref:Reverse transcriptase Ty1/copia-type domain-containing protein n=1 Tax=Popillia japonica TaxID=7064 RepID=A0AAW1JTL5_POPJA